MLTVKSMTRICQAVEKEADIYNKKTIDDITNTSDSVIASACELADKVNAKAIIGLFIISIFAGKLKIIGNRYRRFYFYWY